MSDSYALTRLLTSTVATNVSYRRNSDETRQTRDRIPLESRTPEGSGNNSGLAPVWN